MIKDNDVAIDDVNFEPRRKKIILGSFIAISIVVAIIIFTVQATNYGEPESQTDYYVTNRYGEDGGLDVREEIVKERTEPIELTQELSQTELTQEQKQLKLPQSVLDMTIFINDYPNTPIEKIQILMNYAVGSERGTVDEELDEEARIIFHEVTTTG